MLWWSLLACDDGGTVDRTGETDADADSDADSDADADTDADSDADVDPPEERCTAVVRVDLGSDGNWDREGLDRLDPADPQRLLGTERGPLGGPVDDAWSWTRDPAGNLLTEVHEVDGATVLAVTHTRDADGNEVLLEEDLDGDGAWDVVAATTWVGGAAVARTWDLDGDGIVDRWDTLTNDGEGRVTAVKGHADAAGTVLVYQEQHDYDADRGSSGRTLFDLDGTLPAEEQLRERYDAEGRPVYRGLSTGAPRFADLVEDEDWAWDAAGYLSRHRERTFGVDVSGYPLDLYVDDLFARDAAGQVVTQTSELGVFLDLGPVQQTTALATDLTVRAASPCP